MSSTEPNTALSSVYSTINQNSTIKLYMELGFDKNENKVWEKWNKPVTNSWRYVNSWFNSQKPQVLADLWPGFYQRLHDTTWEKTIKQAIHWYVAANTLAGGLEGAIILAQTGHELLAWTLFVAEIRLPKMDLINFRLLINYDCFSYG